MGGQTEREKSVSRAVSVNMTVSNSIDTYVLEPNVGREDLVLEIL